MDFLTHITLTELRYILAVAQELNFNKAAGICFVSQPTLSIAIKKLENSLGVIIFERNKNRVLITDAGAKIIDKARQVFNLITEIKVIAKENNNPYDTPLRIGAIHTVGPYIFPAIIDKLNEEKSKIKLVVEEDFTDNLHQKLLDATLDVIIVAEPFEYPNIEIMHLFKEPLDIIMHKSHKWISKKSINPNELQNEVLLLLNQGNCFRDQVLQICPQCTLPNKNTASNTITTTSLETIKYMVMRNLGISIMPRHAIDLHNTHYVTKHFTKPTPQRKICLCFRSGFSRTSMLTELVNIIKLSIAP